MQIQMSTQDFFVQEGLENLDQIFGDKSTTSFEKLLEQLKEFSDKIPKMDCRRGMLVYFPVIPGFGKSSLCNGLTPSFVKLQSADRVLMEGDPALQINVAIPQGAQRPRKLTIRAGDAIKEKFWPTVRQEKLKEKSSIYIADKNVPPNSFYIVRDIVESLNLLGVAILPDSGALTDTTVVHRSLTTNGEDILRSYPFSLAFLVICIARVLSREHIGKLDSRSTHACMVVIKFFAFFRGLSSDSLKEQVILQLGGTTITVPFLRKNKIDMPHRLSEALETALSVQMAIDSKQLKDTALEVDNAEAQLRSAIEANRSLIESWGIEEVHAKTAFATQLVDLAFCIDDSAVHSEKAIKIVSIDIVAEDIHGIISNQAKKFPILNDFLKHKTTGLPNMNLDDRMSTEDDEDRTIPRFIKNTHVTMAHCCDVSQRTMRETFSSYICKSFLVKVDGIMFDENVAALCVQDILRIVPGADEESIKSSCSNNFPHITVWCD